MNKQNKIIVQNIKNYFKHHSGNAKGAVINISGGKDSTYVAYLLVKALGRENVFGLLQPNGAQKDIKDSLRVCNLLKIHYAVLNIQDQYFQTEKHVRDHMPTKEKEFELSMINVQPRLRMVNAYAIAQMLNYRVAGTGNASESFVGYCTKWGDLACDFNPIEELTNSGVIELGLDLEIPEDLMIKTPADGLSGKSDEENLGVTYKDIEECRDMVLNNLHKFDTGTPKKDKANFRKTLSKTHKKVFDMCARSIHKRLEPYRMFTADGQYK